MSFALAHTFVILCRWLGLSINRDRWKERSNKRESNRERKERERQTDRERENVAKRVKIAV